MERGQDLGGRKVESMEYRVSSNGGVHALGRAAIAMAAVRSGKLVEPGRLFAHSNVSPPTDATQSRPYLWFASS